MGLFDFVRSQRAFGRTSEHADIAVDVEQTRRAQKTERDTALFESREEKRRRQELERADRELARMERQEKIRKGQGVAGKAYKAAEFISTRYNDYEARQPKRQSNSRRSDYSSMYGMSNNSLSNSNDITDSILGTGRHKRKSKNKDPFDFSDYF